MDGFGRPVQVKKDGVVTTAAKGSAPKDETVMIVSGRNVYDAFGRVAVRCQTKVHNCKCCYLL